MNRKLKNYKLKTYVDLDYEIQMTFEKRMRNEE